MHAQALDELLDCCGAASAALGAQLCCDAVGMQQAVQHLVIRWLVVVEWTVSSATLRVAGVQH